MRPEKQVVEQLRRCVSQWVSGTLVRQRTRRVGPTGRRHYYPAILDVVYEHTFVRILITHVHVRSPAPQPQPRVGARAIPLCIYVGPLVWSWAHLQDCRSAALQQEGGNAQRSVYGHVLCWQRCRCWPRTGLWQLTAVALIGVGSRTS